MKVSILIALLTLSVSVNTYPGALLMRGDPNGPCCGYGSTVNGVRDACNGEAHSVCFEYS